MQFNCEGDRTKDEAIFGEKDSNILSFDAKKSRFGEAFELRNVSLSCKEERDDFERVLRSRSIDDGDECVWNENRCDKHSNDDAYKLTTHIVKLCARERANKTR